MIGFLRAILDALVRVITGQAEAKADLDQFPPGTPACTVCMHWWAQGINGELPKL